ncbi:MAG: tRNA (adenosine(37)-N6)-threonylcarbamoyltransferase complex transferase subunit TsaD [Candidatus Omnitrophica bacterium]|nr:tRNA (adenosine(37)-N6)-threonylcarbamoyltransferase complex transferase subunit TsaD [Candidatus Omnitrophota bacterium]
MNILGIETSCDETSASVVRDGRVILSNIVATSLQEHQKYGGIIPEIASRRQMEFIDLVTRQALNTAGLTLKDLDAVAVTESPGLIGSLVVGRSFAHSLSFALGIPLIKVNHIEAHVYAGYLVDRAQEQLDRLREFPLPAVGLVVSGGHSSLFYIKDFKSFRIFGQTRDDAAGEAYDKVARILGLGYPGGPIIDKLARSVTENDIKFSCAPMEGTNDFSFSGLKTAVLYYTQRNAAKGFAVEKVANAFQESVVNVLVRKTIEACIKKGVASLLVGGGVAANASLRTRLVEAAAVKGIKARFPAIPLCMDNAAMVAGLAQHLL